jgi:threonine aldolase
LAEGLAQMEGLAVDPESAKTNIVYLVVIRHDMTAHGLAERLASNGVRVLPTGFRQLRAVTNYHVTSDDIAYALTVFRSALN